MTRNNSASPSRDGFEKELLSSNRYALLQSGDDGSEFALLQHYRDHHAARAEDASSSQSSRRPRTIKIKDGNETTVESILRKAKNTATDSEVKGNSIQSSPEPEETGPTEYFDPISHTLFYSVLPSDARPTIVDIHLEFEEVAEDGTTYTVLQQLFNNFPLGRLTPASKFVRDQLKGIPEHTWGGTRLIRDIYIPATSISPAALLVMLHYVRKAHLPHPSGTPLPTIEVSPRASRDIRWLCDLYRVYLFLGMHDGDLHPQPDLVDAIKAYFPRQVEIKAEEVMYFWKVCQEDCVLTWRVIDWVLGCTMGQGVDVERAFGRWFEQEPELRHLWEVLKERRASEKKLWKP